MHSVRCEALQCTLSENGHIYQGSYQKSLVSVPTTTSADRTKLFKENISRNSRHKPKAKRNR
jgi:hypothetical protein